MRTMLPDSLYPAVAIAQQGSYIWNVENQSSFVFIPTVVSSGQFIIYGSSDYEERNPAHVADPSLAHWAPLPSWTLAGVETALAVAWAPTLDRAQAGSCSSFRHLRVVEQNAGTASLMLIASGHPVQAIIGAIAVTVSADTELPAAAALADATSNPTVPAVGSFLMLFNGTTWDRARGTTTGGLQTGHGKTIKPASGTLTSDTDVVAAVTSKRIKVHALYLRVITNTEQILIAKSNGTGGTEIWRAYLRGPAADVPDGNNLAVPVPTFLFATAAGEKLTFDVSSGATVHYSLSYWDDDAT